MCACLTLPRAAALRSPSRARCAGHSTRLQYTLTNAANALQVGQDWSYTLKRLLATGMKMVSVPVTCPVLVERCAWGRSPGPGLGTTPQPVPVRPCGRPVPTSSQTLFPNDFVLAWMCNSRQLPCLVPCAQACSFVPREPPNSSAADTALPCHIQTPLTEHLRPPCTRNSPSLTPPSRLTSSQQAESAPPPAPPPACTTTNYPTHSDPLPPLVGSGAHASTSGSSSFPCAWLPSQLSDAVAAAAVDLNNQSAETKQACYTDGVIQDGRGGEVMVRRVVRERAALAHPDYYGAVPPAMEWWGGSRRDCCATHAVRALVRPRFVPTRSRLGRM